MVESGYISLNGYNIPSPQRIYKTNPVAVNYSKVSTTGLPADKFQYSSNSLQQYLSEEYIQNALNTNSKIKQILAEKGIPAEINMKNLREIQTNHGAITQEIAKGIIQNLPQSERYKIDADAISKASYLHDIGKVFIPDEILSKPAILESSEYEIMKTHSILGYELLKDSALDETTKELIKYHHQNRLGTGYPAADIDLSDDLNLQILSVADKYSALTEKRPYKSAMIPEQALGIIYADVQKNKIHPAVFRGLAAYLRKTNVLTNV